MRLKQRMNVLLPQPDGPIIAVTSFGAMSSETPRTAVLPLYETSRSRTWKMASRRPVYGSVVGSARRTGSAMVTTSSGSGCG